MSNKSDAKSSKMRRRYHEDFKRDAVKLSQDLGSVAEAARQLGISESSLCKWRIKYSQQMLPLQPIMPPTVSSKTKWSCLRSNFITHSRPM